MGSGASGMTAALVATVEGASVLLVESTSRIGGTSARSSGTLWIPPVGDAAAAVYLNALVGQEADRPLEPPEFDGRLLGDEFARIGWPIPELTLFGRLMVTRGEAARLLRAGRSVDGTLLAARLLLRYIADRLRYPRGTRLVLGNALIARLYKALLDRQVPVWCEARTQRLIVGEGVHGAVIRRAGKDLRVGARRRRARRRGGFPASAALRGRHFRLPVARYTPAYEGCVGDTLRLGQEVGGAL